MYGKIEVAPYVIFVTSLLACATDLARGKIYNWLTLPVLLLAFAVSFAEGGWPMLAQSLLGASVGFALFGWLFFFGVLGGGDVKLLMAIGAWGDFHLTIEVALLSIILGGIMALGWLFFTKRLKDFWQRIRGSALSLWISELDFVAPAIDRKQTMPFGVPIAVAAVWGELAHPLLQWGILPWVH